MVFNIEVSFNIMKHKNVTEIENEIVNIALCSNCHSYYKMTEMENNKFINRNHIIYVIVFEDSDINNLFTFISKIRRKRAVYIECLYEENILCKMLYASQYYLTTMEKDRVIKYKRERSYSEDEKMLINSIKTHG